MAPHADEAEFLPVTDESTQSLQGGGGGNRLAGKVAVVTGAGSGFGEAIAKKYAFEGAAVVCVDMNEKAAARVVGEIGGEKCISFKADVTNIKDWEALVQKCKEELGGMDILVNNAGTSHQNKPTLEVTEDEFDRVFAVNVKSIFHSVHTVIPLLMEQNRGGSIINTSSIGAHRPRPGLSWYNASKGAVSNVTKSLAAEYGPKGIRVNAILPLMAATGLIETFMGMENTEENRAKFVGNVPMGRLCTPEDVAQAALFLASDESSFVTGQQLEVDGGRGI